MHPLGPSEKACDALNLSLEYSSLSQRSGRKLSGAVQLRRLWHAAHEETATDVYIIVD